MTDLDLVAQASEREHQFFRTSLAFGSLRAPPAKGRAHLQSSLERR